MTTCEIGNTSIVLCVYLFSYRHIEEDGNADVLDTAEDDGEQASGQSAAEKKSESTVTSCFLLIFFLRRMGKNKA